MGASILIATAYGVFLCYYIFMNSSKIGFSRLIFHELGRSSQLKYRKTTYSRLYFHEWEFSREFREIIVA